MKISEIYASVQGEGLLTGVPSAFVRTSGCNLRCWFCDTPYTSWDPEGEDRPVDEILAEVERLAVEHVVVTGGEPMLWAELVPLTAGLRRQGRHITIETAGTLYLPVECDLMSISPKLSNSAPPLTGDVRWRARHERSRHVPEVMHRLLNEYEYQLKFVVDTLADCAEVETYLAAFPQVERVRAMLMPQGLTIDELAQKTIWLEPHCSEQGFTFCPRKQIEWFGPGRGR